VAAEVMNVMVGTPLILNYYTTEAPLRQETAKRMSASMAKCGIQVNVHIVSPAELFAPGPDGILFGRKFDLAEYSWESGLQPPCDLYQTNQIPDPNNNWLKINVTGYSNPEYDNACNLARHTRFDQTDLYQTRQQDVVQLFSRELPVIPLYYRLKMAVSRPDFCGLDIDLTSRSALYNIEAFDFGKNCN
jgi:peptide/nickel transport system substrate-binding protein